jgi:hypothetical protein
MKAPGEYTHYDQPPDYPVWLVQMDGQLQLVGGPLAVITKDGQLIAVTPTPSQPYWGTCTVFIDALSGSVIAVYN